MQQALGTPTLAALGVDESLCRGRCPAADIRKRAEAINRRLGPKLEVPDSEVRTPRFWAGLYSVQTVC